MKKIHKMISYGILLMVALATYLLNAQMTGITAQTLVTFFSIVFGFYITSISILYTASYTKKLHQHIDEKSQKRGTHILRDYLRCIGHWSIFSITSIIIFMIFATKNDTDALSANFTPWIIPFLKIEINANLLLTSFLFGISATNIFYMLLLLYLIINGMIEEAKE